MVIAGGVETMSDVPIRVNRNVRRILLSLNKAKTTGERVGQAMKLFSAHPLNLEVRHCAVREKIKNDLKKTRYFYV